MRSALLDHLVLSYSPTVNFNSIRPTPLCATQLVVTILVAVASVAFYCMSHAEDFKVSPYAVRALSSPNF